MLLPNGQRTSLVAEKAIYIRANKQSLTWVIPKQHLDEFGNIIGCEYKCVDETATPRLRRKYERAKK
jgi:hypothetical protein